MNTRTFAFILLLLLPLAQAPAQPKCRTKHYGLSNGLPQRTVMSIIQDEKGFMWFGTWDGLCKFDGYNFTPCKTFREGITMQSNRINRMEKDSLGYLWIQSYSNEVLRFDPRREEYITSFRNGQQPFLASDILPQPSGKVWLTSTSRGAVCIPDTTNTYTVYSKENGRLPDNSVHGVFEESGGRSWILTGKGVVRITQDACQTFFTPSAGSQAPGYSFFSAYETDTEVWLGTGEGQILCYNKQTERFSPLDTGTGSTIIAIHKVYDNLLFVLTSGEGFLLYDKEKTLLNRCNKATLPALPTNEMRSCYVDRNQTVWIETALPGVARFNVINGQLTYYHTSIYGGSELSESPRFSILEDKSGHVWIHPRGGGFSFYDKATDALLPFPATPLPGQWGLSHLLHDQYIDHQGNMWISTRSDGVEKITFLDETFSTMAFGGQLSSFQHEIRAFLEDRQQNIWMGSKDGRVWVFDSHRHFKGYLSASGRISVTDVPLKAIAYTFHQDKDGAIWMGTRGDGLYLLQPAPGRPDAYTITHFRHNPSDAYSLSHNNVFSLHEDAQGTLWVGTFGGGINRFDREKKRFVHAMNELKGYPQEIGGQVRTVNSRGDKVFVGTTLGLIVLQADGSRAEVPAYRLYTKSYGKEEGLKSNDIFQVYITGDRTVYIATQGGGVSRVDGYDPAGFPQTFRTYDTGNVLPFDVALSVIEDREGKLWMVGEGNLIRFNPRNGQVEQFSDVAGMMENACFSDAVPLMTQEGEILLGQTRGMLSFVPERVKKDDFSPYIAFIRFRTPEGRYPSGGEADAIREIELNHDENSFSIEYAALDFANPASISYAYRLDGLEKEWIQNRNQRVVNYTGLTPGTYEFRVKSTNSSGQWTDNERALRIVIHPSFWQTQWAYMLYAVLFILTLYLILRSIIIFYRMRDKVRLEQEQTEMKTRFYTNISHEIRTPLTLIVSPIEDIVEGNKVSEEVKPQLRVVLKNANRMLNMVNQILDFRKIQKQKLQVREVVFGQWIADLCSSFISTAESRKISLTIQNRMAGERLWVDTDGVEKLLYNLISNALKHTPAGKSIEVSIFRKEAEYALQVRDEGRGMSKEIQGKLFTRFASFDTDKSNPSTGIGLSIVKEIADKHHARIVVESQPGAGATFTVFFLPGLKHFAVDDQVEIITSPQVGVEEEEKEFLANTETTEATEREEAERLSLLVVEDDDDLRSFIKSILAADYHVYEATNGKEGYELATRHLPDFVLSDIMMPQWDGITFLQALRGNGDTSHIPCILLTAKTSVDDELTGVISGADDYITKPFHVKLLKAKIENIIRQRQQFSAHLTGDVPAVSLSSADDAQEAKSYMTPRDEAFIRNLIRIIEEQIDNSELTIDELAAGACLGRKVFYNKVKSLTGLAPVEFVREVRVKKAAELLSTGEYIVKEVAYMVGFSDIKYFSRCFKAIFGVTPAEYKKRT